MEKEMNQIFTMLEQAGMNPQLCDAAIVHDHRRVRCGVPSAAGDADETDFWRMPRRMMGSTMEFLIDVVGDSMRGVGFEPGDHIKVRTGVSTRDGDIVVASIDGEFTVKVLFTDERGRHWLIPQNEDYAPILLTEERQVTIVGRVVELIKDMPSLSCSECMKALRRRQSEIDIPPAKAVVERAIVSVAPQVEHGRQWYAVYRALLDREAVGEGDYAGFVEMVARLAPSHPHPPVASELRRLAVQSFRRSPGLWDRRDAPVQGKRFDDYLRLARQTLDLLG